MRPKPNATATGKKNAPDDESDGPDETPIEFQPESGAVPHDSPPDDEQSERDPRDDI